MRRRFSLEVTSNPVFMIDCRLVQPAVRPRFASSLLRRSRLTQTVQSRVTAALQRLVDRQHFVAMRLHYAAARTARTAAWQELHQVPSEAGCVWQRLAPWPALIGCCTVPLTKVNSNHRCDEAHHC